MRVLVACEFSGIVRDAFRERGHDAWSCDLLPSERPGPHIEEDLRNFHQWAGPWDIGIFHPPCTALSRAGDRWYKGTAARIRALAFFGMCLDLPIQRIAVENSRSWAIEHVYGKPSQVVHPWMFGHGETKATCLWLKNLPPLMATVVSDGREPRVHYAAPGPDRWKERSRTLAGIAAAMADQWGSLSVEVAA